ncbi:MAG: lysoplasmalogenase [Pseudomonadota bacterium]
MPDLSATFIAACIFSVAILLLAERKRARWLKVASKSTAALSFVGLALANGATLSVYGSTILAGLILCAFGDAFLLGRRARFFAAGMVAFGLGHLAYCGAFLPRMEASILPVLAASALIVISVVTIRAHWTQLDVFRWPVIFYAMVIVAMCTFAIGYATTGAPGAIYAGTGAALFALSDVAVARDRFGGDHFANKMIGLPLYFGGQIAIAQSV